MGQTERREETYEASGPSRDSAGSLSLHPEDLTLPEPEEKKKSTFREYAETFAIAILLALFIRTFVVQAFKIPSGSMIPTLAIGDHILVSKFIYGVRLPFTDRTLIPLFAPQYRDIIVFRFPEDESKDFIKRVIGLPGDKIEIKNTVLYRNGEPQTEDFINAREEEPDATLNMTPLGDPFGPITVPEDAYFVMGDNRDHSLDSRFWGFVKNSKIKGKALIIYWSWDSEARWVRFGRIGKMIR